LEVVDLSGKGVMKKAAEKLAQIPSAKETGLELEQDSAEVDGIKFVKTTAKRDGVENTFTRLGSVKTESSSSSWLIRTGTVCCHWG